MRRHIIQNPCSVTEEKDPRGTHRSFSLQGRSRGTPGRSKILPEKDADSLQIRNPKINNKAKIKIMAEVVVVVLVVAII